MSPTSEEINRIAENISRMKIRGAGKIARYAAEALLLTAKQSTTKNSAALVESLKLQPSFY
jgi:ribose 1,5-bisphosphate isomerase